MADPQFEQFRQIFEKLPQHIKAPQHCYKLTHDISPDSCSDDSLEDDGQILTFPESRIGQPGCTFPDQIPQLCRLDGDENRESTLKEPIRDDVGPIQMQNGTRKRRKLPPIPVSQEWNTNAMSASVVFTTRAPSLADEIRQAESASTSDAAGSDAIPSLVHQLPLGVYFDYRNSEETDIGDIVFDRHMPEEDCSPDGKVPSATDFDSGNSTAHSPDGAKCFSPVPNGYVTPCSPVSRSSSLSHGTLELLEATHRGLHKFVLRHADEIDVEIGDPVYVEKEADDLWCEGVNLRTGKRGSFPSAYVTDVDYTDFDPDGVQVKKERYLLQFLGSLEVRCHKGAQVLNQAVNRIARIQNPRPQPCILEVSDQGLRMVDKSKPPPNQVPCHDYFFSLKNVTFCGYHPKDHRYFGFITKHPTQDRFACHVFSGEESTRSVTEAVGRAFHRFYHKFIETAYPVEDIYLE